MPSFVTRRATWWHAAGCFAVFAGLPAVSSGPAADCADRQIDIPLGAGTITCTGVNTCPETNTYAPVPGCALASGSPVPTPGRDLVYTVRMPPGVALDVVAIPTGNWDVALYALSSSDPAEASESCIAGVDAAFNGGEEVLRNLVNDGATTDTLYIVVDSASTSAKFGCGGLDVEFRHRLAASGAGNTCASPLEVEWTDDAVLLEVSTCGNTNTYDLAGGKCAGAFPDTLAGRDLVLQVTVEDSTAWTGTIVPTSAWDPAVLVSRTCTDFTGPCVAAGDEGRVGEAEQLPVIVNAAGAGPATYTILLDSWLGESDLEGCGGVEVRLTRMPFGGTTGESCAEPVSLALGSEPLETGGFTCGFADDVDLGGPCGGLATPGRDIVYAVTVEASAWSVSVTPTGGWDASIGVFSACGTTCIAQADAWGPGVAEALTSIPNATPGTTVFLAVDSRVAAGTSGGCGGFELRLANAVPVPTVSTTWGALKSRYGAR